MFPVPGLEIHPAEASHISPPRRPRHPRIVLFVDRYEDLKFTYQAWFETHMPPDKYEMVFASSLEEAEELMSEHGEHIALVVSGGLIHGKLVWTDIQNREMTVDKDAHTAADVMRVMQKADVQAPFFLVTASVGVFTPLMPRPPEATFPKTGNAMQEIFSLMRRTLGVQPEEKTL